MATKKAKALTDGEMSKILDAFVGDRRAAESLRLMELAHDGAFRAHCEDRFDDEHAGDFSTCPHPDCELVRRVLPERN